MSDDPDLDSAYALETPEDNLRLYRVWAESYDADFVDKTGFRFPELIAGEYVRQGGGWPCLDVGCGTGAVAALMPEGAVLDGLDLSPDMLAVASRKGLYRELIEANLKEPLAIPDESYAGFVSSGTFTHGHVGAEAIPELVRILRPGGLAVHSVKTDLWFDLGFDEIYAALESDGIITQPATREERIYAEGGAPEGHETDTGLVVTFRKR